MRIFVWLDGERLKRTMTMTEYAIKQYNNIVGNIPSLETGDWRDRRHVSTAMLRPAQTAQKPIIRLMTLRLHLRRSPEAVEYIDILPPCEMGGWLAICSTIAPGH